MAFTNTKVYISIFIEAKLSCYRSGYGLSLRRWVVTVIRKGHEGSFGGADIVLLVFLKTAITMPLQRFVLMAK